MKTFCVQTLGCKVNHYESDQISELLRARGLIASEAGLADLRIINTCSVTMQAASQSRQSVRRMVRLPVLAPADASTRASCTASTLELPLTSLPLNATMPRPRIIVTGCWATSNAGEASSLPGVDAVLTHHHHVALELDRLLNLWQEEARNSAGQHTRDIETNSHATVNEKLPMGGVKGVPIFYAGTTAPSPGTPGEGRGEGFLLSSERPSPCPLPEYREREQKSSPQKMGTRGAKGAERGQDSPRLADSPIGTRSLPLLGHRQLGRQRAFLKIQDGCDAHCTYCIIPQLRPALWSKPVDSVVEEAKSLVGAGHVEIVLTGIFLGAYGQPTALRRSQPRPTAEPLGELIEALCSNVKGLRRLRLSSLEPGDLTPQLLELLRAYPQVVPHFHLPLQSGSDALLRRMNRQYTRDSFLKMVEEVNAAFDRPALTTDIVVGFPGETDEEFERTAEVVRAARFIHVHAFPYSPRPGTAAARWTKQFIRGPVVSQRINRLREIALDQSFAYRSTFLDQSVEVIIERDTEEAEATGLATHHFTRHGRCERYFSVLLHNADLQPGHIVSVKIKEVTRDETRGELLSQHTSAPK